MLEKSIRIGTKTVKNRIVLPPMATFGMTNDDNTVSETQIKHYGAYADNGVGLIIIEACAVREMDEPRTTIGAYDRRFLDGLKKLSEATRKNGSVAIVQLINTGLSIMKENSIDEIPQDLFLSYRDDFIKSAGIIKEAGFDGVELHAAHGFYLDQVLETSTRSDMYGKSPKNRAAYVTDIIKGIKQSCGNDFIVGVRLGMHEKTSDTVFMAQEFEKAGADVIHVSFGIRRPEETEEPSLDARIICAGEVKKNISVPVICVGGLKTFEDADGVLQKGYADLAAVGTAQLADHAWAKKVLSGEAPEKCLGCRQCMWWTDGTRCPLARKLFS